MSQDINLVLGPPGTGKTNFLLSRCHQVLESNPGARFMYITYTKAAAKEMQERLSEAGIPDSKCQYVRTLHSLAYKLVSSTEGTSTPKIMTKEHWDDFSDSHGYMVKGSVTVGDDGPMVRMYGYHSDLVGIYDASINHGLSPTEYYRQYMLNPGGPTKYSLEEVEGFVAELEEYMDEKGGLITYSGLLRATIDLDLVPPGVTYAFLDEAQDLSVLQQEAFWHLTKNCKSLWVVGDDDQSIFSFQGANPTWLVELSESDAVKTTVLDRSHRVPEAAHRVAMSVISRNKNRVNKEYLPRSGNKGDVLRGSKMNAAAFLSKSGNWHSAMVLVRARSTAKYWTEMFLSLGVPYSNKTGVGPSPLNKRHLVAAFEGVGSLRSGGVVTREQAVAITSKFMNKPLSRRNRDLFNVPLNLSEIKRIPGINQETENVLRGFVDYVTSPSALEETGAGGVSEFMWSILREYDGEVPKRRVEIMTMHGSKGLEADVVIVDPDVPKMVYESMLDLNEEENRILYVALTRTKRVLYLTHPETEMHYRVEGD